MENYTKTAYQHSDLPDVLIIESVLIAVRIPPSLKPSFWN